MVRLLLVLALVLGLTVAIAHAAKPRRTFAVTPPQQFVTVPVRIHGAHWPRGGGCPAGVPVSVRMPSGKAKAIARPALKADGSFSVSWRTPQSLAGRTVRVRAVEACGSAGTVTSSARLHVLLTPR